MSDYPEAVSEKKNKDNKYGQNGKFSDWEISDMARDITRAEKIKNDPEKMKYVKKCLAEDAAASLNAISSIDDLRKRSQKVARQDNDMEE